VASAIVQCALRPVRTIINSADASRRRRRCFTEDYGAATFAVDVLLVVVSIGHR